jgi:hypothetical protein
MSDPLITFLTVITAVHMILTAIVVITSGALNMHRYLSCFGYSVVTGVVITVLKYS